MWKAKSALTLSILIFVLFSPTALAEGSLSPVYMGGHAADVPSAQLCVQPDDAQHYFIKSINIVGNQDIPTEIIVAAMKTKPGAIFNRLSLVMDLSAIDKLGFFVRQDLVIIPELVSDGLVLTVRVKENLPLNSLVFAGNSVFSSEKLRKIFESQLHKPANLTLLESSINKIESEYREEGYLLAKVSDIKNDTFGDVVMVVDEGIVQEIEIECPTAEHKTVIQHFLTTKIGMPYNEKMLVADLRAAYKTGKFADIQRTLNLSRDKPGGFVLEIKSTPSRYKTVMFPLPILAPVMVPSRQAIVSNWLSSRPVKPALAPSYNDHSMAGYSADPVPERPQAVQINPVCDFTPPDCRPVMLRELQ